MGAAALADNRVSFGCTALVGTNKMGIIKPDADGYRKMVVGGLKMYNSGNSLYLDDEHARRILTDESDEFQRMIQRGVLRGEYGHPKKQDGQTERDYIRRALQIYEDRVCCHFRKVWLDSTSMRDKAGRPIVAIMALVRPSGELGDKLRDHLENPHENVCFSVRSFTKDKRGPDGINRKSLRKVVTFDYVNEPGIEIAEKYKSPSLESFNNHVFSRGSLEAVYDELGHDTGLSMEDTGIRLSLEDLFESLGWRADPRALAYQGW